MSRESILAALERQLRAAGASAEAVRQEPAHSGFFRLFAAAFNQGWLDGCAGARALGADDVHAHLLRSAPELAASPAWRELRAAWREWHYAWQRGFMRDGSGAPPPGGPAATH